MATLRGLLELGQNKHKLQLLLSLFVGGARTKKGVGGEAKPHTCDLKSLYPNVSLCSHSF